MITKTQIKKWNDYFKSLTKEEQRIAIAKDVLLQLKKGKYTAESGTYIRIDDIPYEEYEKSFQEEFNNLSCNCCALGSCMASLVKFTNKATIDEVENENDKVWNRLFKYFSREQLLYIEWAFEGWNINKEGNWNDLPEVGDLLNGRANLKYQKKYKETLEKCLEFHNKYGDSNTILKKIMLNIIKNKGIFKP